MSKENDMITSEEFELALQIIASYKVQLEKQLKEVLVGSSSEKINIQGDIKESAFRVLQKYYRVYYVTKLQWEDLKAMDRHLLENIDFDKMKLLKGYERMSLYKLKQLMISHSILDKDDL
jgi:nanoRNase/pAp phosphatase (c-di-AMP/oligoRNAs hydrolase)